MIPVLDTLSLYFLYPGDTIIIYAVNIHIDLPTGPQAFTLNLRFSNFQLL